jgi:hypothetical protein
MYRTRAVLIFESFPDWALLVFSIPKQRMNNVIRVLRHMIELSSLLVNIHR